FDIGPQSFHDFWPDARDTAKVLDRLKRGFGALVQDSLSQFRSDTGKFLKLLSIGLIDIDRSLEAFLFLGWLLSLGFRWKVSCRLFGNNGIITCLRGFGPNRYPIAHFLVSRGTNSSYASQFFGAAKIAMFLAIGFNLVG